MPLNLKSVANGSVILNPASTVTDKTITLPATDGTMLVQDGTNTTTITNLAYTGTLTGGTGVINIGSGQLYKDASGNVGIGTSSPPVKFSVVTAASTFAASFQGSASTNIVAIGTTGLGASINAYTAGFAAAADLVLQPNGGNLGLGVTPSAWLSSIKAMQIGGNGALYGNNSAGNNTSLVSNAYIDSSSTFRYLTNGYATGYQQFDSSHIWRIAPLGTAGNAITFTQAMTLSASGNLGVGTASPASKLHISAGASSTIQLGDTATTGYYGQINNTSNNLNIIANGDQAYRVSVGTNNGSGNILFFTATGTTGNTERARIDSSGNLLVGTQSSWSSGVKVQISSSGTALSCTTDVNADRDQVYFRTPSGIAGIIRTNTLTTIYATSSDYRLKENVEPMTGALATVAALKPCTYTWKADGSAGQGFIAHELQAVVPDCVTGEKDAVDEDGNPKYQGVDTSFLVATLVAAIQELKAEFDAYKLSHP